jgi:hypothetical protein
MGQFTERQLTQCFNDHRAKYGGVREDYFGVLYLAKRFRLSHEDAIRHVTFGGFDYGVDAYYIDIEPGNLFLYQFKWSDSVATMAKSMDRLTDAGIDAIFGNEPINVNRNEIINRLRADIRERSAEIRRVFVCFVSKNRLPDASGSPALSARIEELGRVTTRISQFFGREVEVIVRLDDDAMPPPHFKIPVRWTSNARYSLETGEHLVVGLVSLHDLVQAYSKMNLLLFQRNIRSGLSEDTPPNQSLKRSFQQIAAGKSDPRAFVFRHNGVSLEVSHIEEKDGSTILVEPRVLNGAQTITSLHRYIFPKKGPSPSEEEIRNLDQIEVIAKIIFGCSESFITEVTIANNKQNPVEPWNLRASDRYQIDLEQSFKDKIGIHYERLENDYVARGESDWEEDGIKTGKVIKIEKLGLTLVAAMGALDRMSRMPDTWENETSYREMFRERFLDEDYDLRRIVLCYKVQFYLRALVSEIASRGERKYGFISRARYLVWSLMIHALLNMDNLPELLEDFGQDLRTSGELKDTLLKLATGKLIPVLREATAIPKYKDLMNEEKYSFLKSTSFSNACRAISNDKFDWSNQRL